MTESLSNAEARRIALAAQGFAEKRPAGRIDRRHLHRVMDRLHLLQLDSVPVVMRTQYLPLFSRLGAYRSELLDEVAYRPHRGRYPWFEAWSHEASLDELLHRSARAHGIASADWIASSTTSGCR